MTPYRCIWCLAAPPARGEVCDECGEVRLNLSEVTLGTLQAEAESRGLTVLVMVQPARAPQGPLWIDLSSDALHTAAESGSVKTATTTPQEGPNA